VEDKEITFDVHEALKHHKDKGARFKVDIIDEVIEKKIPKIITSTPLELTLTNVMEDLTPEHNEELGECFQHLDSSKEVLENKIEDPGTLIKEKPILELKPLPLHLKYIFFRGRG